MKTIDLTAMSKADRPRAEKPAVSEEEEGSGEYELEEGDDMEGPELEELLAKKVAAKDWTGAYEVRKKLHALCMSEE